MAIHHVGEHRLVARPWYALALWLFVSSIASASVSTDLQQVRDVSYQPYRLAPSYYPLTCLGYPLPPPSGTQYVGAGVHAEAYPGVNRDITVRVWRHACHPELGADQQWKPRSALLLRVESTSPESIVFRQMFLYRRMGDAHFRLRHTPEPNTKHRDVVTTRSLTTYVIEETPGAPVATDLNDVFTLTVADQYGNYITELDVGRFDPTRQSYPQLYAPLPINGLLNGIFMDPAHSGEGLNVQVLRAAGDKRLIDVAWFTYDEDGRPFWLGGTAALADGANRVVVPMFHTSGGGFAGAFGSDVSRNRWGQIDLRFESCHEIAFSYSGQKDGGRVPGGTGSRLWQRVARVDQLDCD